MRPLQGISGAPVNGISKTQLASACLPCTITGQGLRVAPLCGAKAGAFLSNLTYNHFFSDLFNRIPCFFVIFYNYGAALR